MAMVTWSMGAHRKTAMLDVLCRKKERDRDHIHPYKVIEITPPPKNLGIRCFPPVGPEFISQLSKHDFSDVVFSSVALHSSLLPLDQQNLQCGESVTIEGQAYTISAVTHRYQLRKGKYEPSEKRLDVLSTGRYVLNLYLEHLLEQS